MLDIYYWQKLMYLRRWNKLKNWSSLIHNRLRNWQWHDALRCLNYKYTIGWAGGTFLIRPDLEFLNFVNTIFIQTKPKFSQVLTPYIWLFSNYKESFGFFEEQVAWRVVHTVDRSMNESVIVWFWWVNCYKRTREIETEAETETREGDESLVFASSVISKNLKRESL